MSEVDDDAEVKGMTAKQEAALLERALRGFDATNVVYQPDRAEMLQDRRFAFIPGATWESQDGGWNDQFANSIRVEMNKAHKGYQKVWDDYTSNRMTVDFRAVVGTGADEDTAELLDGLFRADMYRSKGQQALDNAARDGISGGFGAWRLAAEYEDEFDPDDDTQRIGIRQIEDADQCVFFDLNARMLDKSDAKRCWVVNNHARDTFASEWPGARDNGPDSWPENLYKPFYDWYAPAIVRTCDYYEAEITETARETWVHKVSGEVRKYWSSELEADDAKELRAQGWKRTKTAMHKRKRVHKYILSGCEVLKDCGYIAGDCIPIVPVYYKLAWIDNKERVQGYFTQRKDRERTNNAQWSQLVLTSSLSPVGRPLFTPEQVAGHETAWETANLDHAAYGLVNPIVQPDGSTQAAGPVGMLEAPQVAPAVGALLGLLQQDNAEDVQDGSEKVRANVSAEAMDISAARVDAKSNAFLDMMRQAVQRMGEIYLSMASDIYIEDGRTVETLGAEGEAGEAVLMEPFTDESGEYRVRHDLRSGRFKVICGVEPQTATKRDKALRNMMNLATVAGSIGDTELAQASILTAIDNSDGAGMDDLRAWARKRGLQAGIFKPNDAEMKAMEAQQEQAQPSPEQQMAMAKAQELQANAAYKAAQATTEQARAGLVQGQTMLAVAQAEATLKGDATPNEPNSLDQISKVADIAETEARTNLMRADARKKGADTVSTVAALGPAHQSMRGPQPGDIEDGHMFRGGDPSDAANWQALQ